MSNVVNQSRQAIEKLLQNDEGQLYEQLGLRLSGMADDPFNSGSFDPEFVFSDETMGKSSDILKRFGERFFVRINKQAYNLICGADEKDSEERKSLLETFDLDEASVAAGLTALLMTYLGLAPAIATVVSALIIRLFFKPAHQAMCDVWKVNLE